MLLNVGELFVFTPGRSDYKPLEPSRKSFFCLVAEEDFDDLQVTRGKRAQRQTMLASPYGLNPRL